MATSIYYRQKGKNYPLIIFKAIINAPLNVAIVVAIAFILVPPLHNTLEGVYTAANFITRVRAWIPSFGSVIPQMNKTTVKGLSGEKKTNVEAIISTGKNMSMSDRDIKLALMAASQESSLKNVGYGDDWYFAATGGGKSDSVGLFQQRDPWGTKKCRMTPECSSKLFYNALKQVSGRNSMQEWEAIATVQRPAKQYEQEYQKWSGDAQSYLKSTDNLKVSESVRLPTLKDFDFLGWMGTKKDKEVTAIPERSGTFLLYTLTNRRIAGEQIYKLSVIDGKNIIQTFETVSGIAGKEDRRSTVRGSLNPIPIGEYSIGQTETGSKMFDPAIGYTWIGVTPKFSTGRGDFGIHTDANRQTAPGTAGCIGILKESDTNRLADLVNQYSIKDLVVQ